MLPPEGCARPAGKIARSLASISRFPAPDQRQPSSSQAKKKKQRLAPSPEPSRLMISFDGEPVRCHR